VQKFLMQSGFFRLLHFSHLATPVTEGHNRSSMLNWRGVFSRERTTLIRA
jgi:hypothetical protein